MCSCTKTAIKSVVRWHLTTFLWLRFDNIVVNLQTDITTITLSVLHQQQPECSSWRGPLFFWLTSPGPGEDFDACRWGAGWGAEDTTDAQATGGLGWGVLMGGIGEDSFGWTWAGLCRHWSRLRTWRQKGAGRAAHSFDGAGWTDAALPLRDNKKVLLSCSLVNVWFMFGVHPQCCVRWWEAAELCCEKQHAHRKRSKLKRATVNEEM